MRASRRYEGHIWLASFKGMPAENITEGNIPISTGDDPPPLHQSVCTLLRDFTVITVWWVEEGGKYRLQCFPLRDNSGWLGWAVATSYRGDSLRRMAARAVQDRLTNFRGADSDLSAREIIHEVR